MGSRSDGSSSRIAQNRTIHLPIDMKPKTHHAKHVWQHVGGCAGFGFFVNAQVPLDVQHRAPNEEDRRAACSKLPYSGIHAIVCSPSRRITSRNHCQNERDVRAQKWS